MTAVRIETPLSEDFIEVPLPSNFHFYPFKRLGLRQITGRHQAKFAHAARTMSSSMLLDTVSSLMSDGIRAHDLTPPDFQYILYWLRLHCYGKIQFQHKAVCSNPTHVLDVEAGRKDRKSLITVDVLDRTRLEETLLREDELAEVDVSPVTDWGWDVGPTLQSDLAELMGWMNRDDFVEREYLADFASCLRARDGKPLTLEARILALESAPPEVLIALGKYQAVSSDYGVSEFITTRCLGCGAEIKTAVEFSAHTFLGLDY